jgi:hypothetical protein
MDLPTSRKLTTPWISGNFDDGILWEASGPGWWLRLATLYIPLRLFERDKKVGYLLLQPDKRKKRTGIGTDEKGTGEIDINIPFLGTRSGEPYLQVTLVPRPRRAAWSNRRKRMTKAKPCLHFVQPAKFGKGRGY